MRRLNVRFVPRVESLERLALLATYNLNVTGFVGSIVLDTADSTAHTAFAFPGMQYTLQVNVTGQWVGIKKVTYTLSTPNLDGATTVYTIDLGEPHLTSAPIVHTKTGSSTSFDRVTFGAPKDAQNFTVNVQAEFYQYGGMVTDTILDAVTLKVESPTVTMHTVADASGPTIDAYPFWFGRVVPYGSDYLPNSTGTYLGMMMATSTPAVRKAAGFWATVTNNTHYDLDMGTIQTLDHTSGSAIYTNGYSKAAEASNVLDIETLTQGYWIAHEPIANNGVATALPAPVPGQYTAYTDSPFLAEPAKKVGPTQTHYLQTLYFDIQAQTHLAVAGGFLPSGGPSVDGYPIALSTATWHLQGRAGNTFNLANPNSATSATTLNMTNWAAQLDLASGPGPLPSSLPGAANARWTAPGDMVTKYLSWVGNSVAFTNAYGSSGVGLAVSFRGTPCAPDSQGPGFVALRRPESFLLHPDGNRGRPPSRPSTALRHRLIAQRRLVPQGDSPSIRPRRREFGPRSWAGSVG